MGVLLEHRERYVASRRPFFPVMSALPDEGWRKTRVSRSHFVKIQIQSLNDSRRHQHRRTSYNPKTINKRNDQNRNFKEKRSLAAADGIDNRVLKCQTWLFAEVSWSAGPSGEEDAGAGGLSPGTAAAEEDSPHAGARLLLLLRLGL